MKIGGSGVKKIYELDLTEDERAAFKKSVEYQEPHVERLEG